MSDTYMTIYDHMAYHDPKSSSGFFRLARSPTAFQRAPRCGWRGSLPPGFETFVNAVGGMFPAVWTEHGLVNWDTTVRPIRISNVFYMILYA